ncbi:hypothetical protein COCON_G00134050 [Conger conger]|uniref:Uncharacterized protein n=1 Tax=Conger conger TaxID=82655 RepID=A0A9Q1DEL4_CONCO|nr:hypothetical protein COCON_G00134050 [Conger conger]
MPMDSSGAVWTFFGRVFVPFLWGRRACSEECVQPRLAEEKRGNVKHKSAEQTRVEGGGGGGGSVPLTLEPSFPPLSV